MSPASPVKAPLSRPHIFSARYGALVLCFATTVVGYSSVSPVKWQAAAPVRANPQALEQLDYQLNQGKAIDSLRRDYPRILTHVPDFSIFDPCITLYDPSGPRLSGVQQYQNMFTMLRFLRSTAMSHDEVTYRIFVIDDTIRVRWSAKLWMRGVVTSVPGRPSGVMQLDGVSVYALNSKGLVRWHKLENIVLSSSGAQSINLGFVWPAAG